MRFVAWDGEGITHIPNTPQSYVLFGWHDGNRHNYVTAKRLSREQIFSILMDGARTHPHAIHVSYAFSYDVNMIIQGLPTNLLHTLHTTGELVLYVGMDKYVLEWLPRKWLSVTRDDGLSITIYDMVSFFNSTFLSACESLDLDPQLIAAGKERRNIFTWKEMDFIIRYWEEENRLMVSLATELNNRLTSVGIRITSFHGPGAVANFILKHNKVRDHYGDAPKPVLDAAQYAYMGGRFETLKIGHIGRTVYSMDINSAYPYALTQLPSLAEGEWEHVTHVTRIEHFGVYHIITTGTDMHTMAPLFHRSAHKNISFTWNTDGWYWSPEAELVPLGDIVEGWVWRPTTTVKPFAFIADMYAERRRRKAAGDGAQMALKLGMNSVYGKLAQQVGWDEENFEPPKYHNLMYAGWITSKCRAMIYRMCEAVGFENIVAIETDGIYSLTEPPIETSGELGKWEIALYDDVYYFQPGVALLRKGDRWESKTRGFKERFVDDAGVERVQWSLDIARTFFTGFSAGTHTPLSVLHRKFVGVAAALQRRNTTDINSYHCSWVVDARNLAVPDGFGYSVPNTDTHRLEFIPPNTTSKRVHVATECNACAQGKNAEQMPHQLVIGRDYRLANDYGMDIIQSHKHLLPWVDNVPTAQPHIAVHSEEVDLSYV